MKPEKKTALQELIDSTVFLDLEDLRTVMHEILEEYRESHAEDPEEYLSTEEVISLLRRGYSVRNTARLTGFGISTVQRVKNQFINTNDET